MKRANIVSRASYDSLQSVLDDVLDERDAARADLRAERIWSEAVAKSWGFRCDNLKAELAAAQDQLTATVAAYQAHIGALTDALDEAETQIEALHYEVLEADERE